jgi:hypothetical protein
MPQTDEEGPGFYVSFIEGDRVFAKFIRNEITYKTIEELERRAFQIFFGGK